MNDVMRKLPVIFIMGPTASGKTDLAIELYKHRACELISVDSALVYRNLNIGTAKPTAEELSSAPHHLIDICEPDQPYSASQFCLDAKVLIEKILSKGKIPVLVGGTMLYFKALRDGLADLPEANQTIRKCIADEAEEKGWPFMHEVLKQFDVESAKRIKPTDPQRIQRAIEVYRISGKTLTAYFNEQSKQSLLYPILNIAIAPKDRALLRERIALRFDIMLEQGFIEEVEGLYHQKALSAELPAMRSVGYRQAYEYLSGEIDFSTMREKAIIASHQLAKRQMTWLRSWPDLYWLETGKVDNYQQLTALIDNFKQ